MADAGWYRDPQDPNSEAYWDGAAWTGHTRPAWAPAPPPPPPPVAQPTQVAQPTPLPPPPLAQSTPWAQPTSWAQPQSPFAQPSQWLPPPPPTPPRRRRRVLIAAIAALLAAAGLVTWLVWPSNSAPQLTWHGTTIASPSGVLTEAESTVADLVKARHGASNDATRCYFAQTSPTPAGAKRSDVQDNLLCGPVLFVDGDPAQAYLAVPLAAAGTTRGKQSLTPASTLSGTDPAGLPNDAKLVRPDGKSPPKGTGGLTVPQPPPAERDVLTTAALGRAGDVPPVSHAELIGPDAGITLTRAGVVQRYGVGDDARTAPLGEMLVAFQISSRSGDLTNSGVAHPQLVVGSETPRAVPRTLDSDQYVIVGVPTGATALLRLVAGGVAQTLMLPDGTPGSGNVDVLGRTHRAITLAKRSDVPLHVSTAAGSADITFHAFLNAISLDYWIPGHATRHAVDTHHAVLSISLTYTDPDSPGHIYGFDPELVRLRLPNGIVVKSRNIAKAGHIFDVFDVLATFTRGTIEITGSETVGDATVTVSRPIRFSVALAAG